MNQCCVAERGHTVGICVAKARCTVHPAKKGKQNAHKKQNAIERDRKQHCQPVLSRT